MSQSRFDVVVVGAGLAGLTAAWRLRQKGCSVVLVEASARVGGRMFGFSVGDRVVQLGGRWTGPGQSHVKALAEELGIAVRPLEVFGDAVGQYGSDREVMQAVRRIDELAAAIPLASPWSAPQAAAWDAQTLATFLQEAFGPGAAERLGHRLAGFLPEPQDTSLLHALFYLRSNGGFAGILGLDGPAHDSEVFGGGAHAITDALARHLEGHVVTDAPVHRIEQDEGGVRIWSGARCFAGREVVVAMPPVMAGRIAFLPAMPPARDYLCQRMPIRGKLTIALLYDRPFWRDEGHSGVVANDHVFAWDEGGEARPACITGLVSIRRSRELWELDLASRRAAVVEDVARGLGSRTRDHVGYHEIYWAAEPWTRGCNSYLATGAWTAYGHALRPPVGRIRWAGAEYAEAFVGQMDGAVATAEAAVSAILQGQSTGTAHG